MKFFLFLCLGTMLTSVSAADTTSLIGRWKASPRGTHYTFEFMNDSMMSIVVGTDTTLAKYSLNTDTAAVVPNQIDMHVLDRMSGEVLYTNKGIYERAGGGRIRMRMSENMKDRPRNFMPKGNLDTLLLMRDK